MKEKIQYAIDCILSNEAHGFYDTTMKFRHDGVEWYIFRNFSNEFVIMANLAADAKGVIQ